MISAPNLRQQLSGNKLTFGLLVVWMLWSCSTSRPASGTTGGSTKPPDQSQNEESTSQDEHDEAPEKVDTIHWTTDPTPPIIDDRTPKPSKTIKAIPEITLLLPLDGLHSDLTSAPEPKLSRFLQFYAGAKIAYQHLDSMGLPVHLKVFDSEVSSTFLQQLAKDKKLDQSDVIVGPYDREDIDMVTAFGLANEKMVVSPWLPAFTTDKPNPYFLQMSPGLTTHAEAIMEFIGKTWPDEKVFIVTRNTPAEQNRVQMFRKAGTKELEELIVTDATPDLAKTPLLGLMEEHGKTIFILPYYLKTDENFVNSFLRKLHADKETREVIVIGLPQWLGYTNLNPNYLESLSVHLSISSFIDTAHPKYSSFKSTFFRQNHFVPDLNAFQGYDLVFWLVHQLKRSGPEGLIGQRDNTHDGISQGFDIQPVYKSTDATHTEMETPAYYENKQIRIIRFYQQDYSLVH